jgi:hypothetical protein
MTCNTVRDYSKDEAIVAAVEDARETILCCWDDWEQEAGEDAQNQQSNDAWFDAMNAQIDCVLYGMLDQIPALSVKEGKTS